MDILILGGTRYFGIHLVSQLLQYDHRITIATRGQTADAFGGRVERLTVERTDYLSLRDALKGKEYDVIFDNLAYCSNDVKALLDATQPCRYIMTSTASVYNPLHMGTTEADFDPHTYPLVWCSRNDFPYDEVKRQAECALFQAYPQVNGMAIRFPFVIGPDDYTNRLRFYVEHAIREEAMQVDNADAHMAFIHSREAGTFLAWLATADFTGPMNACSRGTITLRDMLAYITEKTGKFAPLTLDSEPAPYNGAKDYSMVCQKAGDLGYTFSDLRSWIFGLLDILMAETLLS